MVYVLECSKAILLSFEFEGIIWYEDNVVNALKGFDFVSILVIKGHRQFDLGFIIELEA